MAKASVEIGGIDTLRGNGSVINGRCVYQEELAVGAGNVAMTNAVTQAQADGASGPLMARVAPDVDTYYAVGTAPDASLLVATAASTARRRVAAGNSIETTIFVGEKIAVKAF